MGTLSEFNDAIGVTGRDAIDGLFPDAAYDVVGEKVLIHLPHRTHLVKTDGVAKPGAKIPGAISPELWADVGCERVGGSGPNSCMAAKLAAPDVPWILATPMSKSGHTWPALAWRQCIWGLNGFLLMSCWARVTIDLSLSIRIATLEHSHPTTWADCGG